MKDAIEAQKMRDASHKQALKEAEKNKPKLPGLDDALAAQQMRDADHKKELANLAEEAAARRKSQQDSLADAIEAQKQRDASHKQLLKEIADETAAKKKMQQDISDNDVANAVAATNKRKAAQNVTKDEQNAINSSAVKPDGGLGLGFASGLTNAVSGLTAFYTAIHLTTRAMEELRAYEQALNHQHVDRAMASLRQQTAVGFIQAEQTSTLGSNLFNSSANSRYLRNIPGRNETEAANRAMESRTDLTFEQKQFRRQRSETNQGHEEQKKANAEEVIQIDRKLAESKKAQQQYHEMRGKNPVSDKGEGGTIERARKSALSAIGGRQQQIEQRPNTVMHPIARKLLQASGLGGQLVDQMLEARGGKEKGRDKAEFEKEKAAINVEFAKKEEEAQRGVTAEIDKQAVLLEKKRQLQESTHTVTKKQQQEAYTALIGAKETQAQGRQALGMGTFGEMARLKNIQDKGDAIKKQKAENIKAGRDKMHGVNMLTQKELNEGHAAGVLDEETVRDQAENFRKQYGLRNTKHDKDVEDREREHKEMQGASVANEKHAEKDIDKTVDETKNLAGQLVGEMKGLFAQKALVEEVIKQLKETMGQENVAEIARAMLQNFFIGK